MKSLSKPRTLRSDQGFRRISSGQTFVPPLSLIVEKLSHLCLLLVLSTYAAQPQVIRFLESRRDQVSEVTKDLGRFYQGAPGFKSVAEVEIDTAALGAFQNRTRNIGLPSKRMDAFSDAGKYSDNVIVEWKSDGSTDGSGLSIMSVNGKYYGEYIDREFHHQITPYYYNGRWITIAIIRDRRVGLCENELQREGVEGSENE